MSTHKLIWTGDRAALETLDTVLSEVLFPPADAVSLLKDDPTTGDEESGWALHAYFTGSPDADAISAAQDEAGLSLGVPEAEELPDQDWVAHSLEGLGVVQAGDFIVYGSHDKDKVEGLPGHHIQVEANQAFGTGHHPTTAGCLSALTGLKDLSVESILDLGTGSGVLAMAARRLWPEAKIVATDLDLPSVAIARDNAFTNDIRDIHFAEADGIAGLAASEAPYDLILANILAEPLMALAPSMSAALKPGGRAVLAGLLARQEEGVTAAYEEVNLEVVEGLADPTWPVLILAHAE